MSFKKRTRGASVEKADQSFKTKRRGRFFTQCVEMLAALSVLQNVKIFLDQKKKSGKLMGWNLHEDLLWLRKCWNPKSL